VASWAFLRWGICAAYSLVSVQWACLRKENARKREREANGEAGDEGSVKSDEDVSGFSDLIVVK